MKQPLDQPKGSGSSPRQKALIGIGVLLGLFVAGFFLRDTITLTALASREEWLRRIYADHPWLVVSGAFVAYVVITGANIPGATVLSLLYGWYFGFWKGLLLVSFASTAGASSAFLLSRYFLREAVQEKFGDRLQEFHAAWEREGAYYLFTLRLIPLVPFFVINAVMGLTPIRLRTFWWVSQVGMLPGTAVYVYAGAAVPDLATLASRGIGSIVTPRLLIAFALLGLFPLMVRFAFLRWRRSSAPSSE